MHETQTLFRLVSLHFVHRGTQRMLSVKYLFGEAILPRIFYYLRTAKNFAITVPFMYNFRNFLINPLRFSEA